MYVRKSKLSDAEQIRFNEIVFYNLITELMTNNSNPVLIYSFVEALCNLAGCSKIILDSVINIIMEQNQDYAPSKNEMIYLMHKAAVPVREICTGAHISQTTYYKYLGKLEVIATPRFDNRQYEEMMRFLDTLQRLVEPLERRSL